MALLSLRENRTMLIACTRDGIRMVLLSLRENRTMLIACAARSSGSARQTTRRQSAP